MRNTRLKEKKHEKNGHEKQPANLVFFSSVFRSQIVLNTQNFEVDTQNFTQRLKVKNEFCQKN